MKNIYFLCYSRYVILVAYILKKTIHKSDKVTLIISDEMVNEENIAEYIKSTRLWDEVILFHEEGMSPACVEQTVLEFVNNHSIDCFYVAHIMRCASHFFMKYLKENTEINMFDEGCITLDWISSYLFYTRNGLPSGWIDFDFDRVDKIYSFFPTITKAFGKAVVMPIELEIVSNSAVVDELNLLFNYKYKEENIDILFVDTNGTSAGLYTLEYEKYCIDNIFQCINTDNCYIKIKPSENKKIIENKYGKYTAKYIHGGNIPFELIYINMVRAKNIPKMIITVNSMMIWNMLLLNQINNIKLEIMLLYRIMSIYYIDSFWKYDDMMKIEKYRSCLKAAEDIYIPENWREVYDIFEKKPELFITPEKDKAVECELEWLRKQYINLLRKEKYITNYRTNILGGWLDSLYSGKSIVDYFREKDIQKIILYGVGYFGNRFINAVKETDLDIECIIFTNVSEQQIKIDNIPIYSLESFGKIKEKYKFPILITAVGKEEEIKELLVKNEVYNETICFSDIVNVY